MNAREEIQNLLDTLTRQRDELRVKAHLAKLDAMEEWKGLEEKYAEVKVKAAEVGEVAEAAGKDVLAAAKVLGDEIAKGYKRIRDAL